MNWKIWSLVLLGVSLAHGQSQTSSGDVRGEVVDSAGAAISTAKITVVDPERHVARSASVSEGGQYFLSALSPGLYRMRVEAPGFVTKVLEGLRVRVGDSVTMRTVLDAGTLSADVVVPAETPVVDRQRTQ